eukprot:4709949-Pleurochrysis_carterae.AAC.2
MLIASVCRPQPPRDEDQITGARSRRRREVKARTLRARCRKGSGNIGVRVGRRARGGRHRQALPQTFSALRQGQAPTRRERAG